MMKYLLVCSLALLSFSGFSQVKKAPEKKAVVSSTAPVMKTLLDTFSYAAGLSIGQNMKDQGIENLNAELMKRAIDDIFKNRTPLMSHDLANQKLQEQMQIFMEKKNAEESAKAGVEKAKGTAFMNENKKRSNVTTLPNGLQYEVLKAGNPNGAKPLAVDTVVVHYTGTLIDGTKFDSSVDRGEPASFPLNGVIRGWTEILQLMPVGSKWKVTIPSDLAYGDRGAGGTIKPGSTLIFDIELLDIKPAGN
jgi:FKBP-type peptidyl-prolyl cis-trans isomerase FklB